MNVANGFYLPFLRRAGIPTAVNVDGLEWERGKWGPAARAVFRAGAAACARFSDVLIADSHVLVDIWRDSFRVKPLYIPYGAPVITDNSSDRLDALMLPRERYVLIVARLVPENNVDLTLAALARLEPRPPVVVVGTGRDSGLEERLVDLSRAEGFWWLKHVSDQTLLQQLWRHCGVYVHGHSVGGTNPALLQALGAGAPTLALATKFNREVVANDSQLYPHDPQALAQQIAALLASQERRSLLAAQGRQTVARRYSWERVSGDYLTVLVRLAAGAD